MQLDLHIAKAVRILRNGGVIAYPTEAVFGLGCMPDDASAVARLLEIKQRSWRKGLLLIAADIEQVEAWAFLPDGELGRTVAESWPGPVTWALPARERVPPWISGGRGTVAMRVTDHPVARALCRRAGTPLVSTSANIGGRPPIRRLLVLRRQLGRAVDYIVPGALGDRQRPSLIRDAESGRILRTG